VEKGTGENSDAGMAGIKTVIAQEIIEIRPPGGFYADEDVEDDEKGVGPWESLRPRPVVHESDEQGKLPARMRLFYIPEEEGASLVYLNIGNCSGRKKSFNKPHLPIRLFFARSGRSGHNGLNPSAFG
jgi:hypothetical protein